MLFNNKKIAKVSFFLFLFFVICFTFLSIKPVNALNVGVDSGSNYSWYSTLPSTITATYPSQIPIRFYYDLPKFFPSDFENTSDYLGRFETISETEAPLINTNFYLTTSVVQSDFPMTFNDNSFTYYSDIFSLEGTRYTGEILPMNISFLYDDLILPFGYSENSDSPILSRSESQNLMINSDFFTNMSCILYKDFSGVGGNCYFNDVTFEYYQTPNISPLNGDGEINKFSYTWTYDASDNYYLNKYDNTLYPILEETDSFYMLNLNYLLLKFIDEYPYVVSDLGQHLLYFKNINVRGYTENINLTTDRVLACTGCSVNSLESNSFYDSETNEPFSGFYIESVNWSNLSNWPDPVITPIEPVDMTSWLIKSVGAFMDAQLFPGFAIGGILAVLVAFPLAIWLLKVALGG